MAEIVTLNYHNVHEAAADDVLCFDGIYAEIVSDKSFPEGIKCSEMSLYYIIDHYHSVRLVKRGTK